MTQIRTKTCEVCGAAVARQAKRFCSPKCYSAKRTVRPILERLLAKVEKTDTCWLWHGYLDNAGYGRIGTTPGRSALVHRIAYLELVGPIPEGLVLDHLCRNPRCVNPAHLEPVTNEVNIQRGECNANKTHCKRGHELSGRNVHRYRNGRFCRACARFRQNKRRAAMRVGRCA